MKKGIFIAIFLFGWLTQSVWATINPSATYTNSNGEEITVYAKDESGAGSSAAGSLEGDAPLFVRFTANASDLAAGSTLEWRFRHSGAADSNSEITRYEENPDRKSVV